MDGKGAWRGNIFAKRLWRSTKYEEIYLPTRPWIRPRVGIGRCLTFYNSRRPDSAFSGRPRFRRTLPSWHRGAMAMYRGGNPLSNTALFPKNRWKSGLWSKMFLCQTYTACAHYRWLQGMPRVGVGESPWEHHRQTTRSRIFQLVTRLATIAVVPPDDTELRDHRQKTGGRFVERQCVYYSDWWRRIHWKQLRSGLAVA